MCHPCLLSIWSHSFIPKGQIPLPFHPCLYFNPCPLSLWGKRNLPLLRTWSWGSWTDIFPFNWHARKPGTWCKWGCCGVFNMKWKGLVNCIAVALSLISLAHNFLLTLNYFFLAQFSCTIIIIWATIYQDKYRKKIYLEQQACISCAHLNKTNPKEKLDLFLVLWLPPRPPLSFTYSFGFTLSFQVKAFPLPMLQELFPWHCPSTRDKHQLPGFERIR